MNTPHSNNQHNQSHDNHEHKMNEAVATPAETILPDESVKDLVQMFKLLSDETRLRVLFYLAQNQELNVRTLCGLLGQSQPAVSHHLALLRVAGLIESRRDGKHNFYHILPKRFQELMRTFFAASPHDDNRLYLEDFVLSYGKSDDTE